MPWSRRPCPGSCTWTCCGPGSSPTRTSTTTSRSSPGSGWSTGPTRTAFAWTPDDGARARTTSCSTGSTRWRPSRSTATVLAEVGQPAPLATGFDVTRARSCDGRERPRRARSARPVQYANAQSVALGARPAPVPAALRRDPQVGVQLRVGLGHRDLHQRHLAAGAARSRGRPPASPRCACTPSRAATVAAVDASTSSVGPRAPSTPTLGDRLEVARARQTRDRRCRRGRTTVRGRPWTSRRERWWPAGLRRRSRCTTSDRRCSRRRRARLDDAHGSGFRTVRWDTEPDAEGTPFTLVVNDQPVFVKGVNWIPDDALPVRVDARRYAPPLRAGAGREPQPHPRVGRRHLRVRRLLRAVRRAGPADLAGLPVRVRRLRRGGAAALRGRGRGARERRAARPPRLARAAHRQQREPLGLRGLGLEAAPRRQDVGRVLLLRPASRRSSTSSRRTCRTRRAARSARAVDGDADRPHPNDEQHGTMHLWEQWNRRTGPTYRDAPPAVRRRVRLAGAAGVVDADPRGQRRPAHARVAGHDRAPEGARGQRQAHERPAPALPGAGRHGDLALGDAAQPGERRRARARALPLARPAHRRARSSGS